MRRILFTGVISLALGACAVDRDSDVPVGSAVARITTVPPMVACVSITAAGVRTVTDNFDVTPGKPATLKLNNLPVGNDSFSAFAYASPCSMIAMEQPTWASSTPLVAKISSGAVVNLMLTLQPSGGANIGITFEGDADGGTGDGGCDGDGGCTGGDAGFDGGGFDGGFDGGGGFPDLSSFDGGFSLVDLSHP